MRALPAAGAGLPAAPGGPAAIPPPVEYGAAVDRFLACAALGPGSRRVYRIALAGWAWPLTGRPLPAGAERRRTPPPLVALAVLDDPGAGARLAAALADRAAAAGPRTVSRELSALRSAIAWWRAQQWISADPASALGTAPAASRPAPPLSPAQFARLLRHSPSLREHAFWQVLRDSGAPAAQVLALDIGGLDLARDRARRPGHPGESIRWSPAASDLLRWLTAGRTDGPVFLTSRRAAPGAAGACPLTGRARMSYRRAAEIFTAVTRPLDPAGRGWALHQLRRQQRQPKNTSASA